MWRRWPLAGRRHSCQQRARPSPPHRHPHLASARRLPHSCAPRAVCGRPVGVCLGGEGKGGFRAGAEHGGRWVVYLPLGQPSTPPLEVASSAPPVCALRTLDHWETGKHRRVDTSLLAVVRLPSPPPRPPLFPSSPCVSFTLSSHLPSPPFLFRPLFPHLPLFTPLRYTTACTHRTRSAFRSLVALPAPAAPSISRAPGVPWTIFSLAPLGRDYPPPLSPTDLDCLPSHWRVHGASSRSAGRRGHCAAAGALGLGYVDATANGRLQPTNRYPVFFAVRGRLSHPPACRTTRVLHLVSVSHGVFVRGNHPSGRCPLRRGKNARDGVSVGGRRPAALWSADASAAGPSTNGAVSTQGRWRYQQL